MDVSLVLGDNTIFLNQADTLYTHKQPFPQTIEQQSWPHCVSWWIMLGQDMRFISSSIHHKANYTDDRIGEKCYGQKQLLTDSDTYVNQNNCDVETNLENICQWIELVDYWAKRFKFCVLYLQKQITIISETVINNVAPILPLQRHKLKWKPLTVCLCIWFITAIVQDCNIIYQ